MAEVAKVPTDFTWYKENSFECGQLRSAITPAKCLALQEKRPSCLRCDRSLPQEKRAELLALSREGGFVALVEATSAAPAEDAPESPLVSTLRADLARAVEDGKKMKARLEELERQLKATAKDALDVDRLRRDLDAFRNVAKTVEKLRKELAKSRTEVVEAKRDLAVFTGPDVLVLRLETDVDHEAVTIIRTAAESEGATVEEAVLSVLHLMADKRLKVVAPPRPQQATKRTKRRCANG